MTDKQIIIDDVDVSGCECIIEDYQRANNFEGRYEHIKMFANWAKEVQNIITYFAKTTLTATTNNSKAKEQECEELKKDRERWKSNFNGKVSAIEELLQQLDQLKIENEELKKDVIEALKLVEITSTHNTFQETKINRLSKTLTEIKEIAEKAREDLYVCESIIYADDDLREILQKISECDIE